LAVAPTVAEAFSLSEFEEVLVAESDDSVVDLESLEPLEPVDVRLSFMYQPEPLNTTPTFWMTR
jgi:hypothetical protein